MKETAQPGTQRLHIKIGHAEFEAEGPTELVNKQFALFLDAVKSIPTPPEAARELEAGGEGRQPAVENNGQGVNGARPSGVVDRLYLVDRNDRVSLRLLPKSKQADADALLLLLYGYWVIKGQHDVMAVELMKAARKSGLQLSRLDRALAKHKTLLTEGGFAKGKRYGLNNQGIMRAEKLAQEIVG